MGNAALPLIALGAIVIPLGMAWAIVEYRSRQAKRRNNRGLSRHIPTGQ